MDLSRLTIVDWIAIIGGVTGLLGGITGILGAIISGISAYYTARAYRRDEINIKLNYNTGWRVINAPEYDKNSTYTSLSVRNKGRRPVTITKAYYQLLRVKGGAILSDSMIKGATELKEGRSVDFLIKEDSDFKISEIRYFAAQDAVGNIYKLYVTPLYKRIFFDILHFTYIKRKENIDLKNKKNK